MIRRSIRLMRGNSADLGLSKSIDIGMLHLERLHPPSLDLAYSKKIG